MQTKINSFKNYYCDALYCSLGEFIDVFDNFNEDEILKRLTTKDVKSLCEYAVVKNKIAGVGELYLKVPYPLVGREALGKYGLVGKEILSAKTMESLTTKDILGGQLMLMVEDLLDYKEDFLARLSDFLGRLNMTVMICLGQTLEEVGKIVNKFGHSPCEILEDFGFLDRECYIYGLNFIDKDDQKLLSKYDTTLIFSPRSDGEEGKGGINLYNFIYNRLKFGFSSGKCYNIDMLGEAKLASINTNNLMYERGLVKENELLDALSTNDEKMQLNVSLISSHILDSRIEILDEKLKEDYLKLREQIKEIAHKIKE